MNQFLLSTAALSYGGILALFTVEFFGVVPATTTLLPLLVLTCLGIATTAGGLVAIGQTDWFRADALMATGSVLGLVGFGGWPWAVWIYQHRAATCDYFKAVPADTSAQWACPAAAASYYITQILAVGLLIPSLLLLSGLYLAFQQRRRRSISTQTLS